MKNALLLIIISAFLFSCERKKSFWDDFYKTPYVISEKNKELHLHNDSLTTPEEILSYSTKDFGSGYGNLNVIFYNDKIYLHTKNLMFRCRGGSIPAIDEIDYIDLVPIDVTLIANDSINNLINIRKSKLQSLDSSYHLVTISSLSDTIYNPMFNTLMDSVRAINPRFYIRRITEEEHHVLDAKTRNIPYDPKNYKWVMNYGWLPFR